MSLKRLTQLFLFLVAPAVCLAQLDTATILGTVTDSSGALVAGAQVDVQNLGTSVTVTLTTGGDGGFIASALPVGNYAVKVSAKGFKTSTESGVHLNVSDRIKLSIVLQPGSVTEQVTVTSEAPVLQTASSTLGGVVDNQQVSNLPLNGRALTQVLATVPGVSLLSPSPSMNGAGMDRLFETATRFLLDGTDSGQVDSDIPDGGYGTAARMTRASVESISEVRVQASDFSAEYGSASGAVINFITKTGTNQYHGSLFEYFRNEVLDAKLYNFNPSVPEQKGSFRLNQFGGSLGGPIKRDKIFFFGDYEGDRQRQGQQFSTFTPNQAYRDTLTPDVASLIDTLPLPNVPGATSDPNLGAYQANIPTQLREDTFVAKVDDFVTNSDHISARWNFNDSYTASPYGVAPGQSRVTPYRSQFVKLSYTKTISSTLLNELGFGLNRLHTLAGSASDAATRALPVMDILGGTAQPGASLFDLAVGNTSYTYLDTLSWVHGRHQIKLGGQFVRMQLNKAVNFQNYLVFLGLTDVPGSYASNEPFELLTIGNPMEGQRDWQMGFFGQDDFQVNKSLTLNLGLRYELSTTMEEAEGRNRPFDFATGELAAAGTKMFDAPLRDFAPRFGFAWNPQSAKKWVIRGGYGIFYIPINPVGAQLTPANDPVFGQDRTVTLGGDPGLIAFPTPDVQSFPSSGALWVVGSDIPDLRYDHQSFHSAYNQDWNLNIERELFSNTVLQVAYIGNKGTHYMYIINANRIDPGMDHTRPYPNFSDINLETLCCSTNYNSMQATLKHRFSRNLAFNFNYTYSHNLDIGGVNFGTSAQDDHNLAAEYGNADYDVRHYLEFDYTYQLPDTRVLPGWLANGWQINGITVMRSGTPVNVTCACDPLGTGAATGRPDLVPGISPYASNYSLPFQQFNAAAFSLQPVYNPLDPSITCTDQTCSNGAHYGDVRRNSLFGPWVFNWDFSVFKNFRLTERQKLEFRAEFFNLFNTPEFAAPSGDITSPAFGQSLATIGAAGGFGSNRQIQFALKYLF